MNLLLIFIPLLILVAILLTAVVSDVRTRRIPNKLIVLGLALGFLCQLLAIFWYDFYLNFFGVTTISSALLGSLTGFGIFIPLYAFRLLGAGDVKLLAVIGLWLGTEHTLYAALWTLIAGGGLAIAWSIGTGTLRQVLSNIHGMLVGSYISISSGGSISIAKTHVSARLPYAIAITCGTIFEVIRPYF
jgi:prepilin peptidase CpaA